MNDMIRLILYGICVNYREYNKGNKTVPGRVTTTHTEDGHKQDT